MADNNGYNERAFCLVCKAPLSKEEVRAGKCYCKEHQHHAEEDMEILRNAEARAYVPVVAAVLESVMLEYRHALEDLYENPIDDENARIRRSKQAREEVFESERYIKSDDFATLNMDVADPKTVIRRIREDVARNVADKKELEDEISGREDFVNGLKSSISEYKSRIERDSENLQTSIAELTMVKQDIQKAKKYLHKLVQKETYLNSLVNELDKEVKAMKSVRTILCDAVRSVK